MTAYDERIIDMPRSRDRFFIGNAWVTPASDRRFTLIDASTEEVIGTVPEGVEADIDAAVAAARAAFDGPGWSQLPASDRAAVMDRFMAELADRSEDLAEAVSTQNGMPIALSSQLEAQFSLGILQYYAALTRESEAHDVRPSQLGKETLVQRSPVGVVAAIVPWNFPVALAINKIAPAMAAGCTVVIKPSPARCWTAISLPRLPGPQACPQACSTG